MRKKLYEALLTRVATALFIGVLLLFGTGVYKYFHDAIDSRIQSTQTPTQP